MYRQYQKTAMFLLLAMLLSLSLPVMAKGEGGRYREDINGYRIHDQENYRENSWRYINGKRSDSGQQAKRKKNSENKGQLSGKIFFQEPDSNSAKKKRGIDVSRHQGTIDWTLAKNEIDFAILRCGYGGNLENQDDAMFARNVSQCMQLGIPFGVYLYSYAQNTEEAISEAQHVLRLIQGYQLDFPVYYDLEDEKTVGRCSNAGVQAMAETFCTIISNAGYDAGIYASKYWWETKLTAPSYEKWQKWVAQWGQTCTYAGSYRMWQYTNAGRVSGISADVDMDYWFENKVNDVTPAPHQHTYKTIKVVKPTYISKGYTLKKCDCGKTTKTNIKAKLVLKSPAVKAAAGKKKAALSWKKVAGASGYKVYLKTSPKGKYKCIKTQKAIRFVKTKLASRKKYYFAVKAYKKIGGKTVYSKSAYKTVKAN